MRFQAVVLDFGNTLVSWSEVESRQYVAALEDVFVGVLGPQTAFGERAHACRAALEVECAESMREFTVRDWTERMTTDLGADTRERLSADVEHAIREQLPLLCAVSERTQTTIAKLAERVPVGLLSNFTVGESIRAVLERDGVTSHLSALEVSGDHGIRKPHPALFEIVREQLGTPMEKTLMVGDEFWADIYGAYNAGLLTALTHEFVQGPSTDERAPHVSPDRILKSLDELLD